jgi:hypothetical protein
MEVPKEFMDMVCADIQRITGSLNLSTGDKLKLHRELDGRYQACIKDWYVGLWGSNPTGTSVWYGFLENSPTSIGENLDMMKAKLEAYKFQMNAVHTETPTQQINVTTNVNVSITFEEVRSKIEDMTALSRNRQMKYWKRSMSWRKSQKRNLPVKPSGKKLSLSSHLLWIKAQTWLLPSCLW